jgi:hypothetical protein
MLKSALAATLSLCVEAQLGSGIFNDPERKKGWLQQFSELRENVFSMTAMTNWVNDMSEAYDMLSNNERYQTKNSRNHYERGAFRSGEGTPEQIYKRLKLFEDE